MKMKQQMNDLTFDMKQMSVKHVGDHDINDLPPHIDTPDLISLSQMGPQMSLSLSQLSQPSPSVLLPHPL